MDVSDGIKISLEKLAVMQTHLTLMKELETTVARLNSLLLVAAESGLPIRLEAEEKQFQNHPCNLLKLS